MRFPIRVFEVQRPTPPGMMSAPSTKKPNELTSLGLAVESRDEDAARRDAQELLKRQGRDARSLSHTPSGELLAYVYER